MKPYVILKARREKTQVSVLLGQDVVLRANLPPLSKVVHRRAVTTLLEGLSLWTGARVFVALSAGDLESCSVFGLVDELHVGTRSLYYTIEVVKEPRRQPARITGVCDFAYQLPLKAETGGGG